MKVTFWIFLSLFCHLQTISASAGAASYETWLKLQQSTIVKLNQINYSHVNGLRQCACFESKSQEPFCSDVRGVEPPFIRQIINFFGETVAEKVSCKEILNLLVYARLEQDWQEMRNHLSLMKTPDFLADPVKTETMQDVSYINDGLHQKVDYLFSTSPKHEIRNFPILSKLSIAPVAELSETEIKGQTKEYFDFSVNTCLKLAPQFLNVSRWVAKVHGITAGDPKSFCDRLILADDGNIPLSATHRIRKYAASLLLEIQRARVGSFRDEHKKKYLELAQTNPLLLLVDSPRVRLSQLAKILASIEENARDRLESSEVYGGMTYTLPYTRAGWNAQELDANDFETHAKRAYQAWQDQEFKKSMMQIGAVTAVVTACLVPWGRLISVSLQVFKFSCLAGIGLPLNSYFLVDSIFEYRKALNLLFSSIETNQALDNALNKVSSAQTTATISAFLFPIGLNLVEAGMVIKAAKTLL